MRHNLPKAAAAVFGFWLLVAISYDWIHDLASLSDFSNNIAITFRFVLFGAVSGALFLIALRTSKRGVVFGVGLRGLTPSIGTLNIPKAPLRAEVLPSFPAEVTAWMTAQQIEGGVGQSRVALFKALASILVAKAEVPATSIPGGHGGVSLLEHTFSVISEAMRRSDEYQYRGLLYPDGKVAVAPQDPHYRFSPEDPLIPLVTIGHDIGKLECYALIEGTWTEINHSHDSKGSMLLSRLDEFWALPENERILVQRAVGYYHHPLDVPINAGDRAFALIGLLNEADEAASRAENHISMKLQATKVVAPKDLGGQDELISSPNGNTPSAVMEPSGGDQELFEQRLLDAFLALLHEPERINGADQQLRIGFKLGEYTYLSEERIRQILAERLSAPRLASARMGGRRFVLSSKLAEVLDAEGVLFRRHGKKDLAPNTALFRMQMSDPRTGRAVTSWPAVFVLYTDKIGLSSIEDARFPVTLLEPRWGARSGGDSEAKTSPRAPGPSHGTVASFPSQDPHVDIPQSSNCPTAEEGADTEDAPTLPTGISPQTSESRSPKPRMAPAHVLLESAILGRASEGKTVDGVVYLRISDAAQESGLSADEILGLQQELALQGIVIRRGQGGICWVGAPIEEKPKRKNPP